MPARYKSIFLAALVIAFGFGMSELSKYLIITFNIPPVFSFIFTTLVGLVIIYTIGKKLNPGENNDDEENPKDQS